MRKIIKARDVVFIITNHTNPNITDRYDIEVVGRIKNKPMNKILNDNGFIVKSFNNGYYQEITCANNTLYKHNVYHFNNVSFSQMG